MIFPSRRPRHEFHPLEANKRATSRQFRRFLQHENLAPSLATWDQRNSEPQVVRDLQSLQVHPLTSDIDRQFEAPLFRYCLFIATQAYDAIATCVPTAKRILAATEPQLRFGINYQDNTHPDSVGYLAPHYYLIMNLSEHNRQDVMAHYGYNLMLAIHERIHVLTFAAMQEHAGYQHAPTHTHLYRGLTRIYQEALAFFVEMNLAKQIARSEKWMSQQPHWRSYIERFSAITQGDAAAITAAGFHDHYPAGILLARQWQQNGWQTDQLITLIDTILGYEAVEGALWPAGSTDNRAIWNHFREKMYNLRPHVTF